MLYKKLTLFLLVATALILGCQKDVSGPQEENSAQSNNISASPNPRLSYGDSVFFLKNQPGNYIIAPVSKPIETGYFKSIPLGLVIDTITGNINVTQSETGLRYKIYYVSPSDSLLDSVKIVISGIDYRDAIYEIASTPNAYDTAFPIYNARPDILLPCGDDDDDDDGDIDDDDNACIFDETDLDGDGNDDIPGVNQDKLLVDIKKGSIDVEASFHAGIFGSSNPVNGISKDFTFYYRLQDASNRALNKITVRVYHFKKRNDIPQALLDTLAYRNSIIQAVNNRGAGSSAQQSSATSATGWFDLTEAALKPKRPPIIVVVSQ